MIRAKKPARSTLWNLIAGIRAYLRRFITPWYLFPVKLVTYSIYYLVKLIIKILIDLVSMIIDGIIFPFTGLRNFIKSIFVLFLIIYIPVSVLVNADYIVKNYGWYGKFFCSTGTSAMLKKSVVRVVGGFSEGSGFFIASNKILTNFHVITGEPSPKIIFPDGSFTTPIKITGDSVADLAILTIPDKHEDMIMVMMDPVKLIDDEPLLAAGYPLGTSVVGEATVLKGNFIAYRLSRKEPVTYIHTSISIADGMSGGPLVDSCGQVVGINTAGVSGNSFFISAKSILQLMQYFTDREVTKITLDPSKSPEDGVYAFYTYLKVRDMEKGFALLSQEYLKKTNFKEWTNRFTDIIDVEIFRAKVEPGSKDTVFVKFGTKNWVGGEVDLHYYEGVWQTIWEEGVWKMKESNIKEVTNPGWDWFY